MKEYMDHLLARIQEILEAHMKLHYPFKKLRSMGLPSLCQGTTFMGSFEFNEAIAKDKDNNHGFQNKDEKLSRKRFL